ncbi:MAG: ASCH domain-containing protein [Chloroflexota bacterium]
MNAVRILAQAEAVIFQHTLENVLSGKKTQTRRVAKPADEATRDDNGSITVVLVNGRKKWQVGKTYAVQPGRSLPSVARIEVIALEYEPVQAVSHAAAVAEGFTSRDEFLQVWQRIHGDGGVEADVWVIHFKVVSTA